MVDLGHLEADKISVLVAALISLIRTLSVSTAFVGLCTLCNGENFDGAHPVITSFHCYQNLCDNIPDELRSVVEANPSPGAHNGLSLF